MSQNWIFINSPRYRSFVETTKTNKPLFFGATALLLAGGALAASLTSQLTNPNYKEEGAIDKSEELSKLSMHDQVISRSNKAFITKMLKDVHSGNDSARYKAMLDGKLHGTTHGTSMIERKE